MTLASRIRWVAVKSVGRFLFSNELNVYQGHRIPLRPHGCAVCKGVIFYAMCIYCPVEGDGTMGTVWSVSMFKY